MKKKGTKKESRPEEMVSHALTITSEEDEEKNSQALHTGESFNSRAVNLKKYC